MSVVRVLVVSDAHVTVVAVVAAAVAVIDVVAEHYIYSDEQMCSYELQRMA